MPSIIQTRAQRAAAAAAAAASVPGAFPTAPLLSASLGDYRPATNEPPVFAERINITGRHPLLPHIYKCKQHPQRSESYKGDIYVLYGDYTKAGHAELLKNIGDKEPFALPGTWCMQHVGMVYLILFQGFLKLDPHKQPMVYCRNKYGQAGEPDQIKSWALGRCVGVLAQQRFSDLIF